MKHIMVDLETLGTRPGCVVLSIGAVEFSRDGLGQEFYCVLDQASQKEMGLQEDPDTVAWWARQSQAARRVFTDTPVMFEDGLEMFTAYCRAISGVRSTAVWGNGSDFDNAILSVSYAVAQQRLPWEYWNSRCYRTLKKLVPGVTMERKGTYHNALDDAKSQAEHAILILNSKGLWE